MSDPEELKAQRRSLKAKITSTAHRLQGIIKSKNTALIDETLEVLHSTYEQFCTVDLEFSELVGSDTSKYKAFLTVNNLSLSEYSESVFRTYNDALTLVSESQSLPLENNAILAMNNGKKFIAELSALQSDFKFDTAVKLLEKANDCLKDCERVLKELSSSANTGLVAELGSYVTDLQFSIFKVELLVNPCNTIQPSKRDDHFDTSSKNTESCNNESSPSASSEQTVPRVSAGAAGIGSSVRGPVSGGGTVVGSSDCSSIVQVYNSSKTRFDSTPVFTSTTCHSTPHQSCTSRKYKEVPIPSFDGERSK